MTALHDDLLAAHDAGDTARLIALYTQAADQAPDTDTACFFLTHAYIFALEAGDATATALYDRLRAHNRV